MKKIISIILLITMMISMVACGATDTKDDVGSVDLDVSDEVTHIVSYYDMDGNELTSYEVEHGALASDEPIEVEGFDFMGWYISSDLTRKFDFTRPIKEDVQIFGGYTKYQDDTRDFYIVGSGSSDLLSKSNWGENVTDEFKLNKIDLDSVNEYSITLDLKAGDQFQFAIDNQWSNQRGFGYLVTGTVDDVEYLKNAGGLGNTSAEKSNIEVLVDGIYTLTLTTYPYSDLYDTDDEYYTEDTREQFNSNPFDTITFEYIDE